jgi:hypothetical protein
MTKMNTWEEIDEWLKAYGYDEYFNAMNEKKEVQKGSKKIAS